MFAKDFPRRPMRSLIAVERDLLWQPTLALERPPEKRFGGCNIPLGAEQKIHRLACRQHDKEVLMGWTPPDGIDVPKWRC